MAIAPELLSGLGGGMVIGGVWLVKQVAASSNKKMSITDHEKKCALVSERLDRGDKEFKSLSDRIDRILEILLQGK
jgi:hypothetical protein